MKITIITVTFNSGKYLEEAINSVIRQTYNNIEYIIIDGGSNDDTLSIIEKYKKYISYYISEKDNGIYDAMNKGILASTGDIIGFLNSDDTFYDSDVVKKIFDSFNDNTDCVIGDIVFVNNKNNLKRNYTSKNFSIKYFEYGHMPPHPSFYLKKNFYINYGLYDINFKISSDFDLISRLMYKNIINFKIIDLVIVRMRDGGISTKISKKILLNKEILDSCKKNNIKTNIIKIYFKYFFKIFSFLK